MNEAWEGWEGWEQVLLPYIGERGHGGLWEASLRIGNGRGREEGRKE